MPYFRLSCPKAHKVAYAGSHLASLHLLHCPDASLLIPCSLLHSTSYSFFDDLHYNHNTQNRITKRIDDIYYSISCLLVVMNVPFDLISHFDSSYNVHKT